MTRAQRVLVAAALLPPLGWAVMTGLRGGAETIGPCAEAHRAAATYPDYGGVVIPPNIAPLNLKVLEHGSKFCLRIAGGAGNAIEMFNSGGVMRIPAAAWRKLLEANRGGEIHMDIYAKGEGGWTHFETLRDRVAAEEIDPYVVYRYIPPIYNKWDQITLRQRDLRSFEERILFDTAHSKAPDGKTVEGACINCHTFLNHRANRMLIHMRPGHSGQIPAMILVQDGHAEKIDTRSAGMPPAAYISWHPNGKLLAFSRNSIVEMFHTAGVETRIVVDKDSDLGIYNLDTGQAITVPQIARPDRLETFPSWSPDGRYLYFNAAQMPGTEKSKVPQHYDQIRYDLQRISYDPGSGRWGEVETVVAAADLGKSTSLPLVSPDGHYLMFCAHEYGSFPVFLPTSDLYMLDLTVRGARPRKLDEIDSDQSDSWHSWSSNSRWVIFSSKREDGMFARPHIAHLESGGRFSKPFVMPQEDPGFYQRCLMTYNRPELLIEPVTVKASEIARAMNSAARTTGAAPPASSGDQPWQH